MHQQRVGVEKSFEFKKEMVGVAVQTKSHAELFYFPEKSKLRLIGKKDFKHSRSKAQKPTLKSTDTSLINTF